MGIGILRRIGVAAGLAAAAVAGLVAAPARAQPAIATVPYTVDADGALSVAVMVNGRGPYDFIIDTGATLTLAFENLAAIETFAPTGAPKRRILGISGSAMLDTYRIGDIAVGAARMSDHVGVVLADWKPPRKTPHGILGIDFFRRYAVVFNVRERTMSLYPHGGIPKETTRKWRSVRLKTQSFVAASGALYTTRGTLNGAPVTFIIDLGSSATLVNYEAAEAIYAGTISVSNASSVTTASRLKDIFDNRTKVRAGKFRKISIGGAIWRERVIWLNDAPIFEEFGVASQPYGLLGADLLATQDFALDFGENRLYISKINQKKR